jgi:hypothetical protein
MIRTKKTCSKCGEEKFIWKSKGRDKYCKRCWNYLKDQISPPVPLQARKPIASRSKKQLKKDSVYYKLRAIFFKDPKNEFCQARLPGCFGLATDVHHKRGRGKWYLITSTWLAVCRHCHDWIGVNSEAALEMGLSESRLEKEKYEPLDSL